LKQFDPGVVEISRALTCLFLAGVLLMAVNGVSAQDTDTVPGKTAVRNHSPRKATLYSIVLPGLGQVYNHKYWKVPLIYGAGGAFAYYVGYNQLKYKKFRDAYADGTAGSKALIDGRFYEYDILPRGRDHYRRNRDLSVIGLGVIYFLNVVDAMIDASFFYYDVSDDLSLHIQPALFENQGFATAVGFQVNIGF